MVFEKVQIEPITQAIICPGFKKFEKNKNKSLSTNLNPPGQSNLCPYLSKPLQQRGGNP